MKISDSHGMTIIDGSGTLTLTKNDALVRACPGVSRIVIQSLNVQGVQRLRLDATFAALRFIWGK